MDNSSPCQNRRARRSQVLLTATIEHAGASQSVKLRNLSAQGALVESDDLPIEGTAVQFRRNELNAGGRIVWVNGKYAGVAFNQPLNPEEVLRHIPRRETKPMPPQLFARPAVSRHQLSSTERRWIQDWMYTNGVERPGE